RVDRPPIKIPCRLEAIDVEILAMIFRRRGQLLPGDPVPLSRLRLHLARERDRHVALVLVGGGPARMQVERLPVRRTVLEIAVSEVNGGIEDSRDQKDGADGLEQAQQSILHRELASAAS